MITSPIDRPGTRQAPLDVLVVEDDSQLLRTLTDILRARGYAPLPARNGTEGLRMARSSPSPPAIALVDLKLPDMDGMEVVCRLRAFSSSTEVVVLTGHASVESAVGALRQQSHDYLIKPVAPELLIATVKSASDRWFRHQAEEALSRNEERFRRLIEGIEDVVFLIDPDLRIEYASPSLTRVLGYTPEEVQDWKIRDLLNTLDGESPRDIETTLLGASRGTTLELRGRHRDGGLRLLEASLSDLREHPELRGIVLTTRDVTNQRSLERQAFQAHRLDSMGRLATGVAHDFNNILSVILAGSELAMSETGVPEGVQAKLKEIQEAGERAARLTAQLLQLSKGQEVNSEVFSMSELLQGLAPILRQLCGEHVTFAMHLGTDPALVDANPAQVEQIIMNLVVNGRDAMPGGGALTIEVHTTELTDEVARRHEGLTAQRYVAVAVRDTGTGMTQDVKARAFEPFFTTKEAGAGTGFGLSICYGIVRRAGGSIALESAPGEGTRVEVLLPHAGPESSPEDDAARRDQFPLGNESVLLVEDEPAVRELGTFLLGRLGYRVQSAGDGREALEVLHSGASSVDLVVTDVSMPRMSGTELVRALRRSAPGTKVLFLSGHHELPGASVIEGLGPVLNKPFSLASLAHAVRAALDT